MFVPGLRSGLAVGPGRVSRDGVQDRARYAELMHELVDRVSAFNSGYLALPELRLEATRRPELRAVLTKRIREDIDANIGYHAASGLPGDSTSVVLLYLALNWLIVERLTLPGIFTEQQIHELVDAAVRRSLNACPAKVVSYVGRERCRRRSPSGRGPPPVFSCL